MLHFVRHNRTVHASSDSHNTFLVHEWTQHLEFIVLEAALQALLCVHAGPAEGTKLHAQKTFCVFYPIELKLCTMIELFIPNNRIVFVFFILTVFGGEMTSQC